MSQDLENLFELARLYGVQTSYLSATGLRVEAKPEALLAVLRALGAPVGDAGAGGVDLAAGLAARRATLAGRLLPPVVVAWDGRTPDLDLALPEGAETLAWQLDLEAGIRQVWEMKADDLPAAPPAPEALPGAPPRRRLAGGAQLPLGYHTLELTCGGRSARTRVIAAPVGGYLPEGADAARLWGVFLPLYALHSERSWGAGDFTDLDALADWVTGLGGGIVATLPFLAAFLDEPFEPSPYAPASRLFWNEIFVDPRALPEAALPAVASLLADPEIAAEIEALQIIPQVDYRRAAAVKHRIFAAMAEGFFADPGERQADFDRFVASHPELPGYAAFRAVLERQGKSWQGWPERLRDGHVEPGDYDPARQRYHLFVQWAAERQVRALAESARGRGPGLYLDLPLGVHGSAYDVWRHRDLFAQGVSAGAPPDALFKKGQDWGFPPLVPERIREGGYEHLIGCLRHHMEQAGILRIDHVMHLHRLYWVPAGMAATDGVYVTYPADELYAVLCLESHRHQTMLVGENLGTVPPEVDAAMARHHLSGLFIVQFEIGPHGGLNRLPPPTSVASFNTHDMPTFRGFWEGRDIDHLERLGLYTAEEAEGDRRYRGSLVEAMANAVPGGRPEGDPFASVLYARLAELAASPARAVLINLEDLWGEPEPQNVPGTHREMPNWQRKARYSLEELMAHPGLRDLLSWVDELRRKGQE